MPGGAGPPGPPGPPGGARPPRPPGPFAPPDPPEPFGAAVPVERVSAHLWRLAVPSLTLPPATTTNVYAIVAGAEGILVDAGYRDPAAEAAALQALASLGVPRFHTAVLTHHHSDHVQGAARVAAALGAELAAHPLTARVVPGVTRTVDEGDILTVGGPDGLAIHVWHAPGHVQDHLHLYIPADRVVLVGDNMAGEGTVVIIPGDGDLGSYLASLRRLLDHDLDAVGPGHGPVLRPAHAAVRQLIAHRQMREDQVLDALTRGPQTSSQLAAAIYGGQVEPALMGMAERQVRTHLDKLLAEGRVARDGDCWRLQ